MRCKNIEATLKLNLLPKHNCLFHTQKKHVAIGYVNSVSMNEDFDKLLLTLAYANLVGMETAEIHFTHEVLTLTLDRVSAYLDGQITRDEIFYG